MSAKIPIGWTACVEGEAIPYGIPIERLGEDGKRDYGVYVKDSHWTGAWLAYRVVEAERPPLEYPAEPVLTDGEVDRLARLVREYLERLGFAEVVADAAADAVAHGAVEITREEVRNER